MFTAFDAVVARFIDRAVFRPAIATVDAIMDNIVDIMWPGGTRKVGAVT